MPNPKTQKIVYFVRHGESEDNTKPVFASPHSNLTSKGLKQAEYIAERMSKLSFEALISSPYPRAHETAQAIARATGREAELSNLFTERVKPTSIVGKSYEDLEAHAIAEEWKRSLQTPGMKIEDGENFDEIIARADAALAFLEARPEKSMVVVTHGYFLRTLVARAVFGELLSGEIHARFQKRNWIENAGLTALCYTDDTPAPAWHLWVYNDHAHLAD